MLLGIATTVFVIATAVFGTLYLVERSAHDRTRQETSSQLQGVQRELASIEGKLTSSQHTEDFQRDRIADLETRNAEMKDCVDATGALFEAIEAQDEARFDTAIRIMFQAC